MPLDEATRRLAFLLQRDLRRLVEREDARRDRKEDVHFDHVSGVATWETRRGDVIGRWYGEILATYQTKDRILRWSWSGRLPTSSASHAETVFREGQSRGAPQLMMSVVGELDEEDATSLARLGALVARAEAFHVRREAGIVEYLGLFDTPRPRDVSAMTPPPSRYSVPPPAAGPRSLTPAPSAPYRSLPPIREVYEPRAHREHGLPSEPPPVRPSQPPPEPARSAPAIREPARGVLLPVANGALATLTKSCPGYQQGLFVVTVDQDVPEKRRLVVVLVALDADGLLRSLDPPPDLVDAAARMVDVDRHDGNGPWRKLTARITPKPDGGATLHVDVV